MMYFQTLSGELFTLDATNAIDISRRAMVTETPILTQKDRTEGYSVGTRRVEVQGLITYTKSVRQQFVGNPTPDKAIKLINGVMDNHEYFTVFWDNLGEYKLAGDPIKNCVVESFRYVIDEFLDTITVSLILKEIDIRDADGKGSLKETPSPEASSQISDEQAVSSGGVSQTKEQTRSDWLRMYEDLVKASNPVTAKQAITGMVAPD
ncbi:phage baseplate protein [Vibrio cholerae]|uniref:phage baseplate protein n=1 Tax=Vibrio cholerae TaxID=666 RepID=UPI001C30C696